MQQLGLARGLGFNSSPGSGRGGNSAFSSGGFRLLLRPGLLSTFFNVVAANTAPAAEVGLGAEAVEEVEAVEALDVLCLQFCHEEGYAPMCLFNKRTFVKSSAGGNVNPMAAGPGVGGNCSFPKDSDSLVSKDVIASFFSKRGLLAGSKSISDSHGIPWSLPVISNCKRKKGRCTLQWLAQ